MKIGREHTVIEVTVNICKGEICLSGDPPKTPWGNGIPD